MLAIDWTQPPVVAALITGILGAVAAITAALVSRSRGKKSAPQFKQEANFSTDVQQLQAKGNITVGDSTSRKRKKK